MRRKTFDEAREWWLAHQDELSQLRTIEQFTVIYRYGLKGCQPHHLQEVAWKFGITPQSINIHLRHAKFRVDRELLLQAGPAMRLITDYAIEATGQGGLPDLTNVRLRMSLRHQRLGTLNQLLDKSAPWLRLVGVTPPMVDRFRHILAESGFYLRGEVPADARLRTPLSHRVISR